MDSILLVDGFHGMGDGFHDFPDGFHGLANLLFHGHHGFQRGAKTGKKRGGKTKKGKKTRCIPHLRQSPAIDNADGPRLQENEH